MLLEGWVWVYYSSTPFMNGTLKYKSQPYIKINSDKKRLNACLYKLKDKLIVIPWIYRYISKWNLKNMLFFKKNIHKQMHKERTFEKYQSRKSNYHLGKSTAYCHPSLSVIFGFVSINHCSSAHCHWLEGRIYPSLDSS